MKSFIFYENFLTTAESLTDDAEFGKAMRGFLEYAIYGEDKMPDAKENFYGHFLATAFTPSIDTSRKWKDNQIENAKKGGRPTKVSYDEIAEAIIETEGKLTAEDLANRLNMSKNTLLKSQAWKDRIVILSERSLEEATAEKSSDIVTAEATVKESEKSSDIKRSTEGMTVFDF